MINDFSYRDEKLGWHSIVCFFTVRLTGESTKWISFIRLFSSSFKAAEATCRRPITIAGRESDSLRSTWWADNSHPVLEGNAWLQVNFDLLVTKNSNPNCAMEFAWIHVNEKAICRVPNTKEGRLRQLNHKGKLHSWYWTCLLWPTVTLLIHFQWRRTYTFPKASPKDAPILKTASTSVSSIIQSHRKQTPRHWAKTEWHRSGSYRFLYLTTWSVHRSLPL